jgi:hypothetical protein
VRPFTITRAPSRAKVAAIARPMPAVLPLTNAVLPSSCKFTALTLLSAVLSSADQ